MASPFTLPPPRKSSRTKTHRRAATFGSSSFKHKRLDSVDEFDFLTSEVTPDTPSRKTPKSRKSSRHRRHASDPISARKGPRIVNFPGPKSSTRRKFPSKHTRSVSVQHTTRRKSSSSEYSSSEEESPSETEKENKEETEESEGGGSGESSEVSGTTENSEETERRRSRRRRCTPSKSKRKDKHRHYHTVHDRSTSPPIKASQPPPPTTAPPLDSAWIDVLPRMKIGTAMLKYGKHGFPHFRHFQISVDNRKLIWFSKGKKIRDTSVDIYDIDEIIEGQTTPIFKRYYQPKLEESSLSVIYQNRKKTLDVICQNMADYQMWVKGLRGMAALRREEHSPLEINEIVVEIHDPEFDPRLRIKGKARSKAENLERLGNNNERKLIDVEVRRLRKRCSRFQKQSRNARIPEGSREQLFDVLDKIMYDIDLIEQDADCQDFPIARQEIWRVGVEFEAFRHKLLALQKGCGSGFY